VTVRFGASLQEFDSCPDAHERVECIFEPLQATERQARPSFREKEVDAHDPGAQGTQDPLELSQETLDPLWHSAVACLRDLVVESLGCLAECQQRNVRVHLEQVLSGSDRNALTRSQLPAIPGQLLRKGGCETSRPHAARAVRPTLP